MLIGTISDVLQAQAVKLEASNAELADELANLKNKDAELAAGLSTLSKRKQAGHSIQRLSH